MKRALILTVAVGLLLFGCSAFGQEKTPIYFDGYDGNSWDGGGTGFYYGSINGTNVGPHDASPGMLCDDFNDHISNPEGWTAKAFQVSNLLANWGTRGSNTLFGGSVTVGYNGYLEMAILVEDTFGNTLSTIPGIVGPVSADDVSEVLWCLTGGPSNCTKTGANAMSANAYTMLTWLKSLNLSGYNTSQFANLWLYVPSQKGPQEMWGNVVVAEGGAALLYLLLAGVSCFGAMFLRSRNQRANPEMA
jgi:hypothetical protein